MSKAISIFVMICFVFNLILPTPGLAQSAMQALAGPSVLPPAGALVPLSGQFVPPLIKGLEINPQNPLQFNFYVNTGEENIKGEALKAEAEKMIKYFLTSLTLPEKDLWVNLSPYEKDRIIAPELGLTQMGRDLLAEDYLLKQIMASLLYPEDELGKKFWDRVYKKSYEKFGTTDIPTDTFHKIWILPDKAVVYEHGNRVFVTEASLRVMLEEDYLAQRVAREQHLVSSKQETQPQDTSNQIPDTISSQILREIIIPEIQKEVNSGKHFAQLRQIYHALILADWFKDALKESLLGQVYADKKKVKGIEIVNSEESLVNGKNQEPNIIHNSPTTIHSSSNTIHNSRDTIHPSHVDEIYSQYLAAFKKGVCNLVKAEYDPYTKKTLPRKYFSGGLSLIVHRTNTPVLGRQGFREIQGPINSGVVKFNTAFVTADAEQSGRKMSSAIVDRNKASSLIVQKNPDFLTKLQTNQALVIKDELALMKDEDSRDVFYLDKTQGKFKSTSVMKHRIQDLLDRDKIGLLEDPKAPGEYILAMKDKGAVVTPQGDLLISTRTTYPMAQEVPHGSRFFHFYTKFMPKAHMFFQFYGKDGEFNWISDILKQSKVLIVKPGSLGGKLFLVDRYTRTIRIDAGFLGDLNPKTLNKGDVAYYAQQRVFYGLLADAALTIRDEFPDPFERKTLVERIAQKSELTGHNRLEDAVYIYKLKNEIRSEHRKLRHPEIRRILCDRFERIDFLNGRLAKERLIEQFGYAGDVPESELTEILDGIYADNKERMMYEKPTKQKLADPHADHDNLYFAHLQYLADHTLVEDRHVVQVFALTARDSGLFGNKVVIYSELQFAPGWVTETGFGTNAQDFRSSLIDINVGLDAKFQEIENTLFNSIKEDFKNRAIYIVQASEAYKEALSFDKVKKGQLKIGQALVDDIKKNLQVTADMRNLPALLLIMAVRSSAVGEDDPRRAFPGQGSSKLFVWAIKQMLEKLGFNISSLDRVLALMKDLEKIDRRAKEQKELFNQKQKELESAFTQAFAEVAKVLGIELPEGLKIIEPDSVTPWYELLDRIMGALNRKIDSGEIKFSAKEMDELIFDVYVGAWLYVQASLFNVQAINYRLENKMSVYAKKYDDRGHVVPGDLVKMSVLFLPMVFNREGWLTIGRNQSTGAHQMVSTFNHGLTNSLVSGLASAQMIASSYDGTMRREVIPQEGSVLWEVPNPVLQGTIEINFPKGQKGMSMFPDDKKISDLTKGQVMLTEFFEAPIDSEGGFLYTTDENGKMIPRKNEKGEQEYDRWGNPIFESAAVTFQLRSETNARWKNKFMIFQHYLRLRQTDAEKLIKDGRTIAKGGAATSGGVAGALAWITKDTRPEDLDGRIAIATDTDPTMEHLLHQEKDETGRVIHGPLALITAIGSKSTHGYLFCVEQEIVYIGGVGIDVANNELYERYVIVDCENENGLIFDANGLREAEGPKDKEGDFHIEPAGNDVDVRKLAKLAELLGFKIGVNLDHGQSAQKAGALKYWAAGYLLGLKRNERLLGNLGGVAEGFLQYSNYFLSDLIKRFDGGKLSPPEEWKLAQILERELRYVSMSWAERMDYINQGKELPVKVDLSNKKRIVVTVNGKTESYPSVQAFFDARIKEQRVKRTNDPRANDAYDPAKAKDKEEIAYFSDLTKNYLDGKDYFKRVLLPWFMEVYEEMKADPKFVRLQAENVQDRQTREGILKLIDNYIANDQRYPVRVAKKIEKFVKANQDHLSPADNETINEVVSLLNMKTYERLDDRSSDKVWGVHGAKVIDKGRNPYMDYRGLFLFIDNPVVLEWLLDIFVEVVKDGRFPIGIFTPITNDAQNFIQFRHRMFQNGLTPAVVEQGAMAETAGWGTNPRIFLATMLDFLSIGSNDYLMFLFAVSRGLQRAGKEHYAGFNPRHPAFIREIATFVNEMKKFNELIREPLGLPPVTCGFCGNWPAADVLAGAFLQALGLKAVSVTVPSLEKAVTTAAKVIKDPGQLGPDQKKAFDKLLENKDFNIYGLIDENADPKTVDGWSAGQMMKFHRDLPFHYQFLLELDSSKYTLSEDETIETLTLKLHEDQRGLEKLDRAISEFKSEYKESADLKKAEEKAAMVHQVFTLEDIRSAEKFADVMKKIAPLRKERVERVRLMTDKLEIAQQKKVVREYLEKQGYSVFDRSGEPVSDQKLGEIGREFYEEKLETFFRAAVEEAIKEDRPAVLETAYESPDMLEKNADGTAKGMWRFYEEEVLDDDLDDRGLRKLVFKIDAEGKPQTQAIRAAFRAYLNLKKSFPDADMTFSFAFVRDKDEIDRALKIMFQEAVVFKLSEIKATDGTTGKAIGKFLMQLKRRDLQNGSLEEIYAKINKSGILDIKNFRKEFFKQYRFGVSVMIPSNIAIAPELFDPEGRISDIILSREASRILAQFNLAADWNSPNAPIMAGSLIDAERAAYYTENEVKILKTVTDRIKNGRFFFTPLISAQALQDYKRKLALIDVPISLPDSNEARKAVFDTLMRTAEDLERALGAKIGPAPKALGAREEYFNSVEFLTFQTGLIKFIYEAKLLIKKADDLRRWNKPSVVRDGSLEAQLAKLLEMLKPVVQLTHILEEKPSAETAQPQEISSTIIAKTRDELIKEVRAQEVFSRVESAGTPFVDVNLEAAQKAVEAGENIIFLYDAPALKSDLQDLRALAKKEDPDREILIFVKFGIHRDSDFFEPGIRHAALSGFDGLYVENATWQGLEAVGKRIPQYSPGRDFLLGASIKEADIHVSGQKYEEFKRMVSPPDFFVMLKEAPADVNADSIGVNETDVGSSAVKTVAEANERLAEVRLTGFEPGKTSVQDTIKKIEDALGTRTKDSQYKNDGSTQWSSLADLFDNIENVDTYPQLKELLLSFENFDVLVTIEKSGAFSWTWTAKAQAKASSDIIKTGQAGDILSINAALDQDPRFVSSTRTLDLFEPIKEVLGKFGYTNILCSNVIHPDFQIDIETDQEDLVLRINPEDKRWRISQSDVAPDREVERSRAKASLDTITYQLTAEKGEAALSPDEVKARLIKDYGEPLTESWMEVAVPDSEELKKSDPLSMGWADIGNPDPEHTFVLFYGKESRTNKIEAKDLSSAWQITLYGIDRAPDREDNEEVANAASPTTGGIDFKTLNIDRQIKRDTNGVPLAVQFQDIPSINIEGLVPVIINFSVVTDLPMLLGYNVKNIENETVELLADEPKKVSLAK